LLLSSTLTVFMTTTTMAETPDKIGQGRRK
jgi:hypothetical protein